MAEFDVRHWVAEFEAMGGTLEITDPGPVTDHTRSITLTTELHDGDNLQARARKAELRLQLLDPDAVACVVAFLMVRDGLRESVSDGLATADDLRWWERGKVQ